MIRGAKYTRNALTTRLEQRVRRRQKEEARGTGVLKNNVSIIRSLGAVR